VAIIIQPQQIPALTKNDIAAEIEFSKYVEKCRKHRLANIIENTSKDHAVILLRNLMGFAKDQKTNIQMVSGRLSPEVYDDLINDAKLVLDSGCSIEILTLCTEEDLDGNNFSDFVRGHKAGSVTALGTPDKEIAHFFLTGNAYRVEVDDTIKKAYASFNDKDGLIVGMLRKEFAELSTHGLGGERARDSRPVGAD